ncbi:hypothetical protein BUALT_Bualt04G0102000 [Buddleja alternifolia]|uniref:Uncharacterized protein n=1 Tax=Buddleja alternifolia TaxID=168488 RepID=A0AAV6XYI7_9LAMI|nr:hypothetical protein BUALT_Bualt04G0102000 [Buddleja alternifolia]
MEMEGADNSLQSLLCVDEDVSCLDETYNDQDENFDFCSVYESDSESIEMLIQSETTRFHSSGVVSVQTERTWLKRRRLDAIKWIINTRALFGFHFQTAYLSLIYFDWFLSRMSIDNDKLWAIRLLSVACLTLAAKMEECEVPALSEFHVDEYNFEGNMIKRMELLVLKTLEWKMNCVTPFVYLKYFTIKFGEDCRRKDVVNRAVELIVAVMEVVNVMEYRPSVIAAAAVLAAYDYQLTKKDLEVKINAIPLWGSLEKEHIVSCYSLLKEIEMLKTSKSIISPHLRLTHSSFIDVLDGSSITSSVGVKRRLTYIDGDQHCPLHKNPKSQ